MLDAFQVDRRGFLRGAATAAVATSVAASSPSWGAVRTQEHRRFEATSSDGLKLVGEAAGDPGAPEILFVHGLRQSRLSWDRQFDDPALAGFRRVRFDLRGHGDSDKPEDPARYADFGNWADDVAAVMAASGLRRPILVGWSLGGFVTGGYLWRYSGAKLSGINLVDAVTILSPDLLTPLSGRFAISTSSHDLAERTAATADFLLACFNRPPQGTDLQRMMVVNGMTARAVNEGFASAAKPDLRPSFAHYGGPLLLSHGAHDRLVRIAMAERIRALHPTAALSIYADSGHSPFWEEPERFNRELATFAQASWRA